MCPSKFMSRNRFISIFSLAHNIAIINDKYVPKNQPENDSWYRIGSYIIHFLNDKMSKLYHSGRNITVDEGILCPYCGRVHLKVYTKNILDKYGHETVHFFRSLYRTHMKIRELFWKERSDETILLYQWFIRFCRTRIADERFFGNRGLPLSIFLSNRFFLT